MARYVARVRTATSPTDAFAYMADLRNFADWDPGVVGVAQVSGDGPGAGSEYDVTVSTGRREMTLRYRVNEFDPPHSLTAVARTGLLTSTDVVSVTQSADGTDVVYDATLALRFPLSLGDPLLSRVFDRIGDKAAAGLERALDGRLFS